MTQEEWEQREYDLGSQSTFALASAYMACMREHDERLSESRVQGFKDQTREFIVGLADTVYADKPELWAELQRDVYGKK